MNGDQIKHMVDRFLAMKLPKDFDPDGGIRFMPGNNDDMPSGTNLFTAAQMTQIVRHMVEDIPAASPRRGW